MHDQSWRQYFPGGSLSSREDSHLGKAQYFALFLQRMGEPPLYPPHLHQPLVVGFLCLPTWYSPCCVRGGVDGLSWRLIGKEMDGDAGFDVGGLIHPKLAF